VRWIGMAQIGFDWSAGLEWHRAELTGALDLNGTERSLPERWIRMAQS